VCCRYFGGPAMWFLGYPDQALDRVNEAVKLAQDLSHPPSLVIAVAQAARLHQHRREPQASQERAEAAIALCTEHGFGHILGQSNIMIGWALAVQGKEDEGIAHIRQGMSATLSAVVRQVRPFYLALFAEAYGRVGNTDAGLASLEEAMSLVEETGAFWWMAELHRLKGELLLKLSPENIADAEACYNHALEVARGQEAKSLELRAAMSLSRLWQQRGKQEEAHRLLSEIYGWFTEGFDTADLKEANVLLKELV